METSYSRHKNRLNIENHGLDFADFKGWDSEAITFPDSRFDYEDEIRFIDIGMIGGELFMLVYTILEEETDDLPELWRLISWRRLRQREILRYERYFD